MAWCSVKHRDNFIFTKTYEEIKTVEAVEEAA
jgi:hypothetical protein